MRSRQLETALVCFLEEAAMHLGAETSAGAEVAFEVVAQPSRLHRTPLYCYRPLTGEFIRERAPTLQALPGYGAAVQALESLEGLERYLLARGTAHIPTERRERAHAALRALLDDVFEEQTEFTLRPERVSAALARLEESAVAGTDQVSVLVRLHGLAMPSAELPLTGGLLIAQPDALRGVPEEALAGPGDPAHGPHLLVLFSADELDPARAVVQGREVLRDLLRALRLFGDGRVTMGELGWTRVGAGNWRPLVFGGGGRPRGMLVIAPEQEDELRAFCNLVSRRAPHGNEIAWALRRFELGCDRPSDREALTDYLLALRALLEPEGPSSGLLPGRLAALCAVPEQRAALASRTAQAMAHEQAVIAGSAPEQPGSDALVRAMADHLRALLRDVICGHLDPDLPHLADQLLNEDAAAAEQEAPHEDTASETSTDVSEPAEAGEEPDESDTSEGPLEGVIATGPAESPRSAARGAGEAAEAAKPAAPRPVRAYQDMLPF